MRTKRKYDFIDIMKLVVLALTLNGLTRCQLLKIAMLGIQLTVLKRSGRFYNLNKAKSSTTFTPLLNGVIIGQPILIVIFGIESKNLMRPL